MNPYLLTVAFLMLMGILTSSEAVRFSHHAAERHFFTNCVETKETVQRLAAISRVEDYKLNEDAVLDPVPKPKKERKPKPAHPKPKKSVPLEFNFDRPPNNSRLNFYLVLHEDQLIQGYPKGFSLYETAAHLMRELYKEAPFYQNECEVRILDFLLEKKEQMDVFTSPDELNALTFEDEKLHEIFYYMLKGHDGFPSLLNYITFDSDLSHQGGDKKINLLFASTELIRSIFPNHLELVEKLMHMREKFWEKVIEQEEHRKEWPVEKCQNRTQFKDELTATFDLLVKEAGLDEKAYKKVIDLSLGKYGNILLVYDPITGITKREKVYKSLKTKTKNK